MSLRGAYVMASEVNEQTLQQMEEGSTPRSEYYVMLQLADLTLIDAKIIHTNPTWMTRHLVGCNQISWAIANATLATDRFNAIMASGEDVGLPLALCAACRLRKPKIYIITHGSYFRSQNFKRVSRLLRRLSDVHYLCLAESLRTTLIEEFGIARANAHNTGYCADTQFFKYIPAPMGCTHIASAGTANRDYASLVAAISGMEVELTIALGSAWHAACYDQLTNLGNQLPPNVTARRHNYQEIRALYAASAFVVVPLLPGNHACGYAVIADAMAAGRAVIATRTASCSDFIIDGETGFYVKTGDVEDLRARIAYLLQHPERARQMGQAARARMEAYYTVEAYCRRMEQVLRGVPFV